MRKHRLGTTIAGRGPRINRAASTLNIRPEQFWGDTGDTPQPLSPRCRTVCCRRLSCYQVGIDQFCVSLGKDAYLQGHTDAPARRVANLLPPREVPLLREYDVGVVDAMLTGSRVNFKFFSGFLNRQDASISGNLSVSELRVVRCRR